MWIQSKGPQVEVLLRNSCNKLLVERRTTGALGSESDGIVAKGGRAGHVEAGDGIDASEGILVGVPGA